MIQEAEYMSKQPFGKNEQGSDVFLYTLENDQIQASFSDYGATMVSLIYKKTGVDVLLGYDSVEGYIQNSGHLGGFIGRTANRIKDAVFTLNGKTVPVPMIANAINSGTSFMKKQPFFRKATARTGAAEAAIENKLREEIDKLSVD